ncbi:MAG: bifunctional diaminohydroxyphosphoribosylaminopyrimidine deaminase/5-amino-6-(5-phosphoribosylamino)uracil reductase RibD [Fibrobacter sp.]|nr:bifunctional diaminohydroxyphosphoribosylaminopyrimidine deaminase/5-amino-6-(5-phosphoribosylamino)uracil reductase RibD [Fibrobacter sp.]
MQMALEQAVMSIGISRPNPAVGAIVVKQGVVVGKGRTQTPGNAHAEVMALRDAGDLARGADLFVTLEPCCHYGRTPPCTKAIIEAGIHRVFYAHKDPNPLVCDKSKGILQNEGIEVYSGLEACKQAFANDNNAVVSHGFDNLISATTQNIFAQIEHFYEAYDYFVLNKKTFVEIKSAVTKDGYMGTVKKDGKHAPLKITGDAANAWNHSLRSFSDAILVGAGTLLADNPMLDVRYVSGNNPVKIVWGGHFEFSLEHVAELKIFQSLKDQIIIFSCVDQPSLKDRYDVVLLKSDSFVGNWMAMLADLYRRGMHRLMVEPGQSLARLLLNEPSGESLWNRLDLWVSSSNIMPDAMTGLSYPEIPQSVLATGVVQTTSQNVASDTLHVYYEPN